MTTITTRKDLRTQTDKYIVLDGKMYVRQEDEYIRKLYFDLQEVTSILKVEYQELYVLCQKLGIQARANKGKKIRVTLQQLQKLSDIKNEV